MESRLGIFNLLTDPVSLVFFLVAVVFGLVVHEFAHAYVASRQGDQTARLAGRVSLNPLRHLDPLGAVSFLVMGIGWAKPVPVNPYNLKDGKLGDFYVSMAGIITNLVVAFLFALPLRVIQLMGGDVAAVDGVIIQFIQMMVLVNVLLASFNILPFPPLDGSKAIGILVPRSLEPAYQRYLQVGPVILLAIFGLYFITGINFFSPIIDPVYAFFAYLVAGFPTGIF
jgi:Zn-dependent protease